MAGDEEIKNNVVTLKIMSTSEQKKMPESELIEFMKSGSFSGD
jgi:histidyl-tRNA synthetase